MPLLPQQPVVAEILPATNHGGGDLSVNGVAGDAEPRGDFLVGKPVVLAQHQDLAAAAGQSPDRRRDH